jgi:hypothetical protein
MGVWEYGGMGVWGYIAHRSAAKVGESEFMACEYIYEAGERTPISGWP